MKKRSIRGQGAMEYLMTYGWSILVVMVVGIVMWQLGIFDSKQIATTSSGFVKIKPQLAATGYTKDGIFRGTFMNTAGSKVTITGIVLRNNFDGSIICCASQHHVPDGETGCTHSASDVNGDNFDDFYMGADPEGSGIGPTIGLGDNFKLELGNTAGPSPELSCVVACDMPNAERGKVYDVRIDFFYDVDVGGVTTSMRDTGTVRGQFE